MSTVRLDTVRNTIRQRCDLVQSQVITDPEFNVWINDSGGEFNDVMTAAFGSKYNLKRSPSFTLTPNTDVYAISSAPISITDFKALQRLEMLIAGRWQKVPEAKLSEFDRWQDPTISVLGSPLLGYQFLGNSLIFVPVPKQSITLRALYTASWTPLAADGDTFESVDGWHELIVVDCCLKAQIKQDLPTQDFAMQKATVLARIEAVKHQRNAAEPPRITDVTNDGERPPRWGYP